MKKRKSVRDLIAVPVSGDQQLSQLLQILRCPAVSLGRCPGSGFSLAQRQVRTGLGLKEYRSRLQAHCRMKDSAGYIGSQGASLPGKGHGLRHLTRIRKQNDAQSSTDQDEGFIFLGIKVTVRADVG